MGPLLALVLMVAFADDFRRVFWLAVIPGAVSVAILVFAVHEPPASRPARGGLGPMRWRELTHLGGLFWGVVAVGGVLTLARFSEAFLILRAADAASPRASCRSSS